MTIACTGKDVMSSTCYDFAAVFASYVSDNFISDYQKLIPGKSKILFLDPSLFTQLAEYGSLARFLKAQP